jgi:hypothetical protein
MFFLTTSFPHLLRRGTVIERKKINNASICHGKKQ